MAAQSSKLRFVWSGIFGLVLGCLLAGWFFSNDVAPGQNDDGEAVSITLLQLNDVYEITPLNDQGGLARVATVKQELKAANPDTYALIAGDLVSPSAVGLAKIDGKRLSGKQMIATLNAMGMDYATLGNHEFDIKENELLERLAESSFTWISSNVTRADGEPFPGVVTNTTFDVHQHGHTVRVGIFSLTLDSARRDWVRYDMDLAGVAREQVRLLREEQQAHIVLALTHLNLRQDMALAERVTGIDLILGGHEHENVQVRRGPGFTPVVKADANAKSVYIHQLRYRPASGALSIDSDVRLVTDAIPDEPETARVVESWMSKAFASFRAQGLHPERVVAVTGVELDGMEASIRNGQTELTRILLAGMAASFPEADGVIINSGTIRIDDVISAGSKVTEYDILRILPFGNRMTLVSIRGDLLQKVVEQGERNRGSGGYLQRSGIEKGDDGWLVGDQPLVAARDYAIVMSDFLLTGAEGGLDYLKPDTPGIDILREGDDLRNALMQQLKTEAAKP